MLFSELLFQIKIFHKESWGKEDPGFISLCYKSICIKYNQLSKHAIWLNNL